LTGGQIWGTAYPKSRRRDYDGNLLYDRITLKIIIEDDDMIDKEDVVEDDAK
jgi:hypothetical protein